MTKSPASQAAGRKLNPSVACSFAASRRTLQPGAWRSRPRTCCTSRAAANSRRRTTPCFAGDTRMARAPTHLPRFAVSLCSNRQPDTCVTSLAVGRRPWMLSARSGLCSPRRQTRRSSWRLDRSRRSTSTHGSSEPVLNSGASSAALSCAALPLAGQPGASRASRTLSLDACAAARASSAASVTLAVTNHLPQRAGGYS